MFRWGFHLTLIETDKYFDFFLRRRSLHEMYRTFYEGLCVCLLYSDAPYYVSNLSLHNDLYLVNATVVLIHSLSPCPLILKTDLVDWSDQWTSYGYSQSVFSHL